MKPKYILSKRAEQDLTSIWRYRAETWSQKQANKYIQAILTAFLKIAKGLRWSVARMNTFVGGTESIPVANT